MIRNVSIWVIVFCFLLACIGPLVSGDRLVTSVPENQKFTITDTIDAVGIIDDSSSIDWIIGSGNNLTDHKLTGGENIGIASYDDLLMTNGGFFSDKKAISFDSKGKGRGLYNLETGKVLTYVGQNGSHLNGMETYNVNVAGDILGLDSNIRCVLGQQPFTVIPAFCNVVRASSQLTNLNSAKISESGSIRMVGSLSTPVVLNYQIAISPDSITGSDHASGSVSTLFGGSILEGRDNETNFTSATNSWKDKDEVSGDIHLLKKTFVYGSGLYL